jgi:hypothetical protein
MPNETAANSSASDQTVRSENRIYSLDSFWARFVPPAAIAFAWWLSGIELIETCEREKDWKILAVGFPVFWLAASGSRLVVRRPREALRMATALALVGLLSGWLSSIVGSYLSHVLYGATHALIIGSLGLLLFVAMTRRPNSQTPASKGAMSAPPTINAKEPVKTTETQP